jgi:CheY-like chemotaxis protein
MDASASERISDGSVERAGGAVLVVEGSTAARHALAELLREYGHSVQAAASMRELAHRSLGPTERPELAFLEFRPRDGRGDEAAQALRARWPGLFVVYLSCVQPEDDHALEQALGEPRTALLLKPTSLEAILQVIGTARGTRAGRN